MKNSEIHLRDPFVLAYDGKYYLYGTRGETSWGIAYGFDVYVSFDLEEWSDPIEVFHKPVDFWADMHYWAPEVHQYKGAFYMFATFKKEGKYRGTQILKSDSPTGPFEIHSDGPATPSDWECLDGTLYIDKNGNPYMVFCHEWTQIHDGEICYVALSEDLKYATSGPKVMFKASEAPWIHPIKDENNFVTDGPFLYRCEDGELLMLWSSFGEDGYTEAIAKSDNGEITGNWKQEELLFKKDGGHGMIFKSFDNKIFLALHTPNEAFAERPKFFELIDNDSMLTVKSSI